MNRSLKSLSLVASLLLSGISITWAEVSTSELPILTGTEVHTLHSESVGDDFVLYVHLPPEAFTEPERRFPVLYAMDGDHSFPMICSAVTQLSWSGAVPPVIVVGVGYGTLDLNNGNHRSRDLSPQPYPGAEDSGGGAAFHQFLTEDVFSYIEAKYPVDTEARYLFGHSLGGLFSLYTYMKTPEYFQGIIAGSPLLAGQLELLESTSTSPDPRNCKLFVATGDEEDAKLFIDDLATLRTKLEAGWSAEGHFEMVLIPGFDHFTMVAPAISKGLKSVFAPAVASE